VSAAAPVQQPDHTRSGERATDTGAAAAPAFRGGGAARLAALSPARPAPTVRVARPLAVLRRRSHLPEPHPTAATAKRRRGAAAGAPQVPEPAPRACSGTLCGRRAHLRVAVDAGVTGLHL